jgi:alanine dehydrogenase
MKLGIPKEVKDHEYRVGMIPAGVKELTDAGHEVLVQAGAGLGSGISDEEYADAGAIVVDGIEDVYGQAEMVVKVKEPVAQEYELLRRGQILFTYLHLAPLPELTGVLLEREVTGIAYETIVDKKGNLPLLTPMSEVAGRMAVFVGTYYQQRPLGGRGTLLPGVPGVPPGDVLIGSRSWTRTSSACASSTTSSTATSPPSPATPTTFSPASAAPTSSSARS